MPHSLRLALYQPDMPSNMGTMMRLCTCLGAGMDIIEPCGFPFDDAKVRRAAMDYIDHLDYARHRSWKDFADQIGECRLVLLTTKGDTPYTDFAFRADDILMVGRESAGAPDDIHARAAARLVIPMADGLRSLNVAVGAAMVLGEALRQMREQA
ncbi:MAG: tRNA (cytidine(34)-2'-O)-methyltransferase [Alphaproteobacteria bacterium]|nr:tRNA (cytidine(34)-2'-O)-methyltransferase [Alphaproteobacteria bacterium]